MLKPELSRPQNKQNLQQQQKDRYQKINSDVLVKGSVNRVNAQLYSPGQTESQVIERALTCGLKDYWGSSIEGERLDYLDYLETRVFFLSCQFCRIVNKCVFLAACDLGYYGYKCRKECQCRLPHMNVECDHRDGQCYCEPGYTTLYCNQSKSRVMC